jgi:hypothetical protein
MTQPPNVHGHMQITLPDDVVAGTYADFVSVWHNNDIFVLDFAVLVQPPMPGQDQSGQPVLVAPARVVQRVRIPPAQVFEVMKALEQQLTAWEHETGKSPPTEPGRPE